MRRPFVVLLFFILFSQTFSTQYLIWIAPFMPFLTTLEVVLYFISVSLTWLYFSVWGDVVTLQSLAMGLLIGRNIILVILFLVSFMTLLTKPKKSSNI